MNINQLTKAVESIELSLDKIANEGYKKVMNNDLTTVIDTFRRIEEINDLLEKVFSKAINNGFAEVLGYCTYVRKIPKRNAHNKFEYEDFEEDILFIQMNGSFFFCGKYINQGLLYFDKVHHSTVVERFHSSFTHDKAENILRNYIKN